MICNAYRAGYNCDREKKHKGMHRAYNEQVDENLFWSPRMSKVICKNGHRFKAEKEGPFWPIKCPHPNCGEEAATPEWWRQNPNGTTTIIVKEEKDGTQSH